jgi:hypothetical protein
VIVWGELRDGDEVVVKRDKQQLTLTLKRGDATEVDSVPMRDVVSVQYCEVVVRLRRLLQRFGTR